MTLTSFYGSPTCLPSLLARKGAEHARCSCIFRHLFWRPRWSGRGSRCGKWTGLHDGDGDAERGDFGSEGFGNTFDRKFGRL